MLLTGYSSYALIPMEATSPPLPIPLQPGGPFSFASYQAREAIRRRSASLRQYPYSKTWTTGGNTRLKADPCIQTHRPPNASTPIMTQKEEGRLSATIQNAFTSEDHDLQRTGSPQRDALHREQLAVEPVLTPELNMWFPRITKPRPSGPHASRLTEDGKQHDRSLGKRHYWIRQETTPRGLTSQGERIARRSSKQTYPPR